MKKWIFMKQNNEIFHETKNRKIKKYFFEIL